MNAIPRRYVLAGQSVARRVPTTLEGRGLVSPFSEWVMTAHAGRVWLFGVLDPRRLERLERYTDQRLVHHLSAVCDGIPVYLSNTNGLRYGFLLSQRPRLPRTVDFPGCRRGLVRLGVGSTGEGVAAQWDDLGHVLVAGMTGAGKSNLLRLLVHQAKAEGAALLLADLDGATFPMLEHDPALLAPIAHTPEEVHNVVARALAECDRRAALYQTVASFPENLEEYNTEVTKTGWDPLPRLLVVLDEFSTTTTTLGGNRGQFATDVTSLAWRGRKFGVNLVFAAQDFSKSVVGRVRDQVRAVICFRVRSPEVARNVGTIGADKIPEDIPGRAVTDRWGPLQVYYLEKKTLTTKSASEILTNRERALVKWALESNDDYLALTDIQDQAGMGHREARRLAEEWERRGWLRKDRNAKNRRKVTDELAALAAKLQT